MKFKESQVEPHKTVLIVVDVQNDFCHPEGACARRGNDVSGVKVMMPKLHKLIEGARKHGVKIIYIQTFHEEATDSSAWTARSDGRSGEVCRTGTWGADFYEVSPQPGDIIVNSVLRTLKAETLVMTGVSTNVCVESTARHGYMLDYNIIFMKDACASYSKQAHEMTLENIDQYFGTVLGVDDLLQAWERMKASVAEPIAH